MKKHMFQIFALLAFIFVFAACQKENINEAEDTSAALSIADAESMSDDANDEALFRLDPDYVEGDCPSITYTHPKGTYPNTITLDFGESCTGRNGRTRSGLIVITVSDEMSVPGAVRTVTPTDYFVNGWAVQGTRTVTNLGLNDLGQMQWRVVVDDASVTDLEGGVATWSADCTRTLIEGQDTETCEDNVYSVTGGSSGVSRKGHEFTATITSPLIKPMNCRWIVSGGREVTVAGRDGTRSLDFGNGECDNQATLTLPGGAVREITLRR